MIKSVSLEDILFLVSLLPPHAHYMQVSQIRKYCFVTWIHDKIFFIQINLLQAPLLSCQLSGYCHNQISEDLAI